MIDPILPAPAPPPATTLGEHAEGEFSVFTDLLAVFSRVVDEQPPGDDAGQGNREETTRGGPPAHMAAPLEPPVFPVAPRRGHHLAPVLGHDEGGQLPRPITQIIPVPQPGPGVPNAWPLDDRPPAPAEPVPVEPAPSEPAPSEPVPGEDAPVEEPAIPAEADEPDAAPPQATVDLTDRARLRELLGDRPALRRLLGDAAPSPERAAGPSETPAPVTGPSIDLARPEVEQRPVAPPEIDLTPDLVRLAGDLPPGPTIRTPGAPAAFTPPFADAAQAPAVGLELPSPAQVERLEAASTEPTVVQDGSIDAVDAPAHDGLERTVETSAPERRPMRPLVNRLVERIESWIRRTENMPPPRTMTLRGAHLDGMTIRVSMAVNGLMIQVEGADGADINWVRQVGEELTEHGFEVADISEYQEEGERRPLWDEEEAQRRRERREQRFASREELMEMIRGGSR